MPDSIINTRPQTKLKKAISLILLAAFFNTVMIAFVKTAAQILPIQIILFARYFITLIIILPFIYFNPEKQSPIDYLKTNRLPLHLIRDVLGLISLFFYFYAAKIITLADAMVLFNTAPLFIPIIAFFWGKLKIFPRILWGMGTGFLGIIIILHPGQELFHFSAFAGLLSGFLAAIVFVGGRYLTYTEPPLRNMFYYFLVGTLIAFFMLFTIRKNFWNLLDIKAILLLLGVGAFGYLYQLCFTHGTKYAPVRLTSSFMYTSVIFALIIDWVIWETIPSLFSLLGISLIILGACLLLLFYPKNDDVRRH